MRRPSLDNLETDWARTRPAPPSDLGSPDPLLAFGTPSLVALVLPIAQCRSTLAEPAPRNVPLSANIISIRMFMPTINELHISGLQQITNPQPRNIILLIVPGRARARAAGERRIRLVCTHAHVPTARSGAQTPQGGEPAIPTLIESVKNRHTTPTTTPSHTNRFLFDILYRY